MRRVYLLGASNLTIGIPLVLEILRQSFREPLEIAAAHGHGRSYGRWNRVLIRDLPGILECGLWEQMERYDSTHKRPLAVITDVGNDLLYGHDVATVIDWVATCLERVAVHNADIVITNLPVKRLERLNATQYYFIRTLLFPECRIDWETMKGRAYALNTALEELTARFSAKLITPSLDWYGFDPIHIRRSKRCQAWLKILNASEVTANLDAFQRPGMMAIGKSWLLRPAERRLFGRTQHGYQPALTLDDGTTLWLY